MDIDIDLDRYRYINAALKPAKVSFLKEAFVIYTVLVETTGSVQNAEHRKL